MVSKTKFLISDNKIKEIFSQYGIDNITNISPLGDGEYNAVFEVKADKSYVLKLAPDSKTAVLTYEDKMMSSEVFWYDQIRKHTDIRVPEVYFTDYSKSIIPTEYFIMEKLDGEMRSTAKLGIEAVRENTALMLAQIHKIKNNKFGYVQNQLYDNWYDALCSMIKNLLDDAKRVGKQSKKGERLLEYAEKYKDILTNVESTMVNYDLWDGNVICCTDKNGKTEHCWIDPERSFWGDRIFDFICVDNNPFFGLKSKQKAIEIYNKTADKPVEINHENEIRYAFAQGLLGVIQEVEKYYRYTPRHFGWWRNVIFNIVTYKAAFKVLKNG
ncbi:MAG: aminoglycoside phosphotransferase family protein [Eubacterium sp.]|nr:aminoglycoside phosphotransferase family protein [Eubacterium sp.]